MAEDKVQAIPVYRSGAEVLRKLEEERSNNGRPAAAVAMYSSVVGGIVLDPAMMVIPIDDHMVHRGHGVFDTAMIMDGCLYELDAHLHRFLGSASKARIEHGFTHDQLRGILVQMTAASGCRRGSIRYWLSSGPGNFLLPPPPPSTAAAAFYGVVIAEEYQQCRHGVRAVTTAVPMKPPLFATMKNVNYLPNVLSIMDAQDRGAFASVWVDGDGYVAEGPMVNVAFVTRDAELLLPTFDNILAGCTAKRLLALAPRLVDAGVLSAVSNRSITAEEAKRTCVEMAFVGSSLPLLPILQWDDQPIGDAQVGPTMMALSDLLWEDMKSGPDRIPVPYPY